MVEVDTHAKVEVRRARDADVDAIGGLWQLLVEFHNPLDPALPHAAVEGARRYARRVRSHLDDPMACVLIAEQDGSVIGYVLGVVIDLSPEMFEQERTGFLADIFVDERYRRLGAGRALMDALTDWFSAQGLQSYEWYVAARNAEGMAFWQAMGGQPLMIRMRASLPVSK